MNPKDYTDVLEEKTSRAYEVAEEARGQERDPETKVDVPVAEDLAAKSVGLVTADQFPELEDEGVEERIRELEEEYGKNDERVALVIGREIAEGGFHGFDTLEESVDAGIRIGLAYMTGGIVTAPLEGIADVEIRENDDGSDYLAVYYSGPIRSAGGTASAMSVLLADHIRKEVGIDRYKPRDEEIDRYATEVEDYFKRVTKKQYTPEREETRMIAENVPIEITGTPTEEKEVSNHKDLPRIDTNRIRGGMCLVYLDGLPLKASKLRRKVEDFGEEFGLENWGWLDEYLELQHDIHSSESEDEEEEDSGYEPSDKYLGSLTAGRPIFSHPGRKGGFRLRYGRGRVTGLAAVSFHPATMEITDSFMAIGTQLKTEYPGKAAVSTPVDSIEPPVVRLDSGEVVRPETREEARELEGDIEEILFMGDVLVPYGEFLENGKDLLPSPYVEEWWVQDLKEEQEGSEMGVEPYIGGEIPNVRTAFTLSRELDVPLHPDWTFHWDNLDFEDFEDLYRAVESTGDRRISKEAKDALEDLYVEHTVEDDEVVLSEDDRYVLDQLLRPGDSDLEDFREGIREGIEEVSGVEVREQSPVFLGARMGRPEKAERRTLKGKPQLLFPCGREEGGRMRNLSDTYKEGKLESGVIGNLCTECNRVVPFSYCPFCGSETEPVRKCQKCGKKTKKETHCGMEAERAWDREIDVEELMDEALDNLGMEEPPELLKSPRSVTGRHRHVEPLEKGLLRQKHDLYVNKDGTVRYDATDLPMTHFKPEEIGVSVERLRELGYEEDVDGKELVSEDQVVELKNQDIIIPDNPVEGASAADFMLKAARFVDDLLEDFYGLEPYYGVEEKEDLIGELVVGLAPHTSGGVIGRIIGFTEAKGVYSHPFWHAAKRRNCVPGDTEVLTPEGPETIASLFDSGEEGGTVDRFGTEKVEVDRAVVSYDREDKTAEEKEVEAVYRTTAQDHLIEFTTGSGRKIEVFPDHRMWTSDGVKRAREVEEGENLFTQREIPPGKTSEDEYIDVLDFVDEGGVMARNCSEHVEEIIESLGGLTSAAEIAGVSPKDLDNYRRRESIPVEVLKELEGASGAEPIEEVEIAAKRDDVEIPRMLDRRQLAHLLGLYAAEGYSRRSRKKGEEFYQVNICHGEGELEGLIEDAVSRVFGIDPGEGDHERVISSRIVYELFQGLGTGEDAHTKRVPEAVMHGSEEEVKEFLSAYFAGDGSVEAGRLHVSCQSVSRELIEDVGLLLQRMGIFYRIRERTRSASGVLLEKYGEDYYEGREFTSHKLHIRSGHAVSFGRKIGFALERKQEALEEDYGMEGVTREIREGDLVEDEVVEVEVARSDESYMYDIEVADNHNFATGCGVVSQNCDGDEDSILLLMDALLNFSRQFLPDQRGTRTMDAPLILSTVLHPDEVDDESWNVDVAGSYSREFYEATQEMPGPGEVEVEIAEDLIETGGSFDYTHETGDIRDGPTESNYVSLGEMEEKVEAQLEMGRRINAVDEDQVAELLLEKHFLPDIRGNLRAFSEQRFRCVDCNEKYRRAPLKGRCKECGGKLLLTVSEGTIRKYLVHSEEISDHFAISPYLRQQIMILKRNIESLFGKDDRQSSLGQFVA